MHHDDQYPELTAEAMQEEEEQEPLDPETVLRLRILDLRQKLGDAERELEDIHRGQTGTFGRLRYGDRVRLKRQYGPHSPKENSEGSITFIWDDGQVAVKFDNYEQGFAYWPRDLELVTPNESDSEKG